MRKPSNRGAKAAETRKAPPATPAAGVDDDEMRPEYDFRGGIRGKYAARFAAGLPIRAVVLAPDVAEAFGSARAVNAALRRVLRERERAGDSKRGSRRPT